jgi:hypothetical protein
MNNTSYCEEIERTIGELFSCSNVGEYTRIRTPYLYPDGDVVDLFLKMNGDVVTLTDLGETLRWLSMQTLAKQRSKKQDSLINSICQTHRIEFYRGMLITRLDTSESLAYSLVRLAQAALQVADLCFAFKTRGFTSIKEEVEDVLIELRFPYERDYKIRGASGSDRKVDFYVRPPQKTSLIKVLSTGSRSNAKILTDTTFATWHDLGSLRSSITSVNFISLIDDTEDVWSEDNFSFLAEYSDLVYWSDPDTLREKLVGAN